MSHFVIILSKSFTEKADAQTMMMRMCYRNIWPNMNNPTLKIYFNKSGLFKQTRYTETIAEWFTFPCIFQVDPRCFLGHIVEYLDVLCLVEHVTCNHFS